MDGSHLVDGDMCVMLYSVCGDEYQRRRMFKLHVTNAHTFVFGGQSKHNVKRVKDNTHHKKW